jgi:superfamily II DNA or RNA helicase
MISKQCLNNKFITLSNHQLNVINKMFKEDGLIVVHSTGSGKTLTAIGVSECLLQEGKINNIIVAVPRVLVDNFKKELYNYGLSNLHIDKYYHINTYYKTLKYTNDINETKLNKSLLIIDEGHNIRTQITYKANTNKQELAHGKTAYNYIKLSKKCKKILILTATPLINKPQDFNNIMQMVNKTGKVMSMNKFNDCYVSPNLKKITRQQRQGMSFLKIFNTNDPVNMKSVQKRLTKFIKAISSTDVEKRRAKFFTNKVDFYKVDVVSKFYPKKETNNIQIPMSRNYYSLYLKVEKKIIKNLGELKNFNIQGKNTASYYISLRKFSNSISTDGYKVDWIIKKLKENYKSNVKTLVSSQFIVTGLNLIINELKKLDIPYFSITGKSKVKDINKSIKTFNSAIRGGIMLISGSASEGLDLRGVREVIVMEPFWNLNNQAQVIGRAVRFKSHYHLPKNEQLVKIYKLFLIKPKSKWIILKENLKYFSTGDKTPSVDAYLFLLGILKQSIINAFLKNIKKYN